jgi:transposase
MNDAGSEALSDAAQLFVLNAHRQELLHLTAESVARWVKERWDVCCALRGISAVLRQLGSVYKKPTLVPGKADAAEQKAFLKLKFESETGRNTNNNLLLT